MEAKYLFNTIKYAKSLKVISDIDISLDDFDSFINANKFCFSLNNGASYTYNLALAESKENDIALASLRELMPITVIIDLINEGIKLGIITDVSNDFNSANLDLTDLDYLKITSIPCYYFKINSEMFDDIIYKITFDKKYHDIKNKVEYASRTSEFVDTLIKRIMAKYNILLVKRASWVDNGAPQLPLVDNLKCDFVDIKDSSFETDLIENQLKVLVNYRDNFNNTTINENVIDDIFINLNGANVSYGFFKILGTDDSEPIYDVINDNISVDDVDSLLRIRNLINDSLVKFNIFETLRNNKDSNLATLINSRIKLYDKELNQDPKIEFTITPLSIYCNHIVQKMAEYKIVSNNPNYKDYELEYSILYNPADIENAEFPIYGDGDMDVLKKNDKLVLAFDDIYTSKNELKPRMSSTRYSTMLYGLHERYNNDKYKDIYFINESLVKIIDNNLVPYDDKPDEFTYLKSQVVRGEVSGKYIFIEDAIKVNDEDILGVDLLDIDKDRYISKDYMRTCDTCGHIFGAELDVWNSYKSRHLLQNEVEHKSCCRNCKGTILNTGFVALYASSQKKYYLDDPNKLNYTEVCNLCDNMDEAFIYKDNDAKSNNICKICNKYYCNKHIENNICYNCSQKTTKRDTINNSKLLRLIKANIDPKDALDKDLQFNYNLDNNSLWVYLKKNNKIITYYLLISDDEKYAHLMGKYVKRGDE